MDGVLLLLLVIVGLLFCMATNQRPHRGGSVFLEPPPTPYPHNFPRPPGIIATPEERAAHHEAVVRYCRDHPEFDLSVHRGY